MTVIRENKKVTQLKNCYVIPRMVRKGFTRGILKEYPNLIKLQKLVILRKREEKNIIEDGNLSIDYGVYKELRVFDIVLSGKSTDTMSYILELVKDSNLL